MDPLYSGLGNASTGILWPNLLKKKLSNETEVQLYDYAYNGAHANGKLTNFGQRIPDTRTQMKNYISDLQSGKVDHKSQEALHVLWIGINPLDAIWIDACSPDRNNGTGAQYPSDPPFLIATERIQRQVEEVHYQIVQLRNDTLTDKFPSSFLIVTVPNISIAPLQRELAQGWGKGDTEKETNVLALLRLLIEQYNNGLISIFSQIRTTHDVTSRFVKHGIENISGRCYDNNTPCADIDKYFFWDYLHPTPIVEKILAQDMYEFITNPYYQYYAERRGSMIDLPLRSNISNQIIID
ncbi:uncharacterized protein MELLADRAFT_104982 [Melampsora larici-populina 98AG31]|uniref:Carbohydrate esterase family 16 protein n=1 Tax=Melampsora larici-populina (strain 98AG31 / pathotype 3-4-7) TaxID=747676 RepID=F4RG45_MELLP|nr:uncharacterized protein MELLADRAFT_104982 [Melampsora larici-populina 98AG31]EGG08544.1 hypothetical protein MELLADRAFT_104982 [Melampsora larici-populina 98AG31]